MCWVGFLAPVLKAGDGNSYLKTARRKVKTLGRRAAAEAREAAKRVPEGMVMVSAGEFWMGCNPKVDSECDAVEKPGVPMTYRVYKRGRIAWSLEAKEG